jgi:hypothetical protein
VLKADKCSAWQAKKKPLERGFLKAKEGLLLDASLVFGVFFLGAINFLVVHFALSKRWSANQHECGNDGSDHEFHRGTSELKKFEKTWRISA